VGQRQHLEVPLQESTLLPQRFFSAGIETAGETVIGKDSKTPAGAPKKRLQTAEPVQTYAHKLFCQGTQKGASHD
jgi:hypothetical protein